MDRERLERYLQDRTRLAEPPAGAFSGAAGGAACGDLARISLVVEDGRVAAVTFAAEGCGAARAAAAAAAELAEGKAILAAARLGEEDVNAALGGLNPGKRHASQLAADALHRALAAVAASGARLDAEASHDPSLPPGQGPGAPERVLVAMSGGVDSAVAALLERERGAEVAAVTVKLWADVHTDGAKACCSPQAVLGARRLAHGLGIPHLTLDLEGEFRDRVVADFLAGYASGRTPNPCVVCNGEVRIAAMAALAQRLGAAKLVTGHYARLEDDGAGPLLASAADAAKDQSYMLAALPPALLEQLRFPLAGLTKTQVREIAAANELPVAGKPESQDLCFLAGQSKADFLRRHSGLGEREGDVLDTRGRAIGRHRGHHNFTVGQRRGIGVAAREPLYVLRTDPERNTVTVGTRAELATRAVRLRDGVLHRDGDRVDAVRLRYHAKPVPARLVDRPAAGRHRVLELRLEEPVLGAAPGQTAVLLGDGLVIGHATIARPRTGARPVEVRGALTASAS